MMCMTELYGGVCHRTSTPHKSGNKMKEKKKTKKMSFQLPFLVLPLLGLLSGVKPHLQLLALVSPFSGNPKVRYDIAFNLGPFYMNKPHFF